MGTVSQAGRSVSAYLSRFFLAMRAGISFGGYRDTYKIFGYKRVLEYEDLRERVKRQDIVKTCMYKPAEAIWANPPIVRGSKSFEDAWKKFITTHRLWSTLLRVDKMLATDPYVALFLGLPGEPNKGVGTGSAGDLYYMQPYGAHDASLSVFDTNIASPRYGLPLKYTISTRFNQGASRSLEAHHSRIIHLTNELTEDNLYSDPRIVVGWNLFDDLLKLAGGSAETYWLTANRGMQVDVDKEMDLSEEDGNALADELDEFQNQLRRYIRTRGVKITNLGSDVADPSGAFRVTIALISAAYGIPQRVLMGAEAGALASEQDRANWAETVQNRRETFAEPCILIPLIEQLSNLGVLPKVRPVDLTFEWPNAFHLSPLERAQTMAQSARAIVNLSRQSQYGHPVCSTSEARLICGLPADAPERVKLPEVTDVVSGNTKTGGKTTDAATSDADATAVTGSDQGSDGIDDTSKGTDSSTGATTTPGKEIQNA